MSRARASAAGSHRILRIVEFCCWLGGGLAIMFVALCAWESHAFQATQAQRLEHLEQAVETLTSSQTARSAETRLQTGDLVGEISIPRIGVSAVIAEGVDAGTLRRAVGHFPGTPTPDATGTVVLAGHRDTFFRPLADIQLNDLIVLRTPGGEHQYRVVRTSVVGPRDVSILRSTPQSDLTLVTCFPFQYIGPAPERFVVQAIHVAPAVVRTASLNPEGRTENNVTPLPPEMYAEQHSLQQIRSILAPYVSDIVPAFRRSEGWARAWWYRVKAEWRSLGLN